MSEYFEGCLFDRERIVENLLIPIIENKTGALSLTINAPWGYGKTTFLEHTKELLEKKRKLYSRVI